MRRIGMIIYLVVGVLVASANNYLGDIDSIGGLLNLVLAITLWPLVLLGVDFNLKFGGGGGDRKGALLAGAPLLFGRAAIGALARRDPR